MVSIAQRSVRRFTTATMSGRILVSHSAASPSPSAAPASDASSARSGCSSTTSARERPSLSAWVSCSRTTRVACHPGPVPGPTGPWLFSAGPQSLTISVGCHDVPSTSPSCRPGGTIGITWPGMVAPRMKGSQACGR